MPKVIINANIAMVLTGCDGSHYPAQQTAAKQVTELVNKLHEYGVTPATENASNASIPSHSNTLEIS